MSRSPRCFGHVKCCLIIQMRLKRKLDHCVGHYDSLFMTLKSVLSLSSSREGNPNGVCLREQKENTCESGCEKYQPCSDVRRNKDEEAVRLK